MRDEIKVVKATVNGEKKEVEFTIPIPEDYAEATKVWGKEGLYALGVRMFLTDKTNAQRVIMKGGEAKEKRAKMKTLLDAIMADDDLKARVSEETGIDL